MTPSRSKRVRIYQSSYRQQTAPVATMPPHDYEGCRAVGNYAQPGHHIDCPHLWILQQAFRQHTMICETDYLFYCMSTLKEGKINMFLLKHSFFYNIPCGCFYMSTTSSSPVYLGVIIYLSLYDEQAHNNNWSYGYSGVTIGFTPYSTPPTNPDFRSPFFPPPSPPLHIHSPKNRIQPSICSWKQYFPTTHFASKASHNMYADVYWHHVQ